MNGILVLESGGGGPSSRKRVVGHLNVVANNKKQIFKYQTSYGGIMYIVYNVGVIFIHVIK